MTTPAPLVWDSYRSVGAVNGLGGNVHYYDEAGQAIYLNNGIATQVTQVDDGHWKDAVYGSEIVIDNTAYTLLSLDHPYNGILHLAATDGAALYYLRYVYAMDIADIVTGTWKSQVDNPISQLSASVQNAGAGIFAGSATLFNPGAKMSLALRLGDCDPYAIGVAYLDDIDYDETAKTIPISGRNTTGYLLKEQTFDETTSITGYAHEVAAAILTLAGITTYHLQTSDHSFTHTFKPEQTLLSGLQQLMEFYIGWQMVELPDGYIVMGYPAFIRTYQANSYYQYNVGSEVFKRKTSKSADAAYTHIYVTGKDADGVDLTPIYLAVNHFDYWALGPHKTCHITAPDGKTQEELATYAAQCALDLQYVGIGEQFAGPMRPQLIVGDVASIYETGDTEAISLGAITEITQHFGESGFYTDFAIDSGGEVTDGEDYVITRNAALTGYNRRPRMTDLIRSISRGSKWGN